MLNVQHDRQAQPIMRFVPELRGSQVVIDAPLPDTSRGRDAAVMVRNGTLRGLSVEFRSIREARQSGIRHIQKAMSRAAPALSIQVATATALKCEARAA